MKVLWNSERNKYFKFCILNESLINIIFIMNVIGNIRFKEIGNFFFVFIICLVFERSYIMNLYFLFFD